MFLLSATTELDIFKVRRSLYYVRCTTLLVVVAVLTTERRLAE